jgi:pimeloyl-ACP methyl ester carboxylesterase
MKRLFWLALFFTTVMSAPLFAGDPGYLRKDEGAKSVVIFVHGIFGNAKDTWTNANKTYFPQLVADDAQFNGVDIYVYEYPTSFLNGPFSINEIAENMRLFFDSDAVTAHQNLFFVVHSMGGLATRAYLLKNRGAAAKSRMIYFFSTPTEGSQIASIATLVSSNPQLAKMQPMQSASYLADLQLDWLAADFQIPSYCAYETQKTYGISVVTQASASNLCNKPLDPINADHISIVKPSGNRDVPFLVFKSAFSQILALGPFEPGTTAAQVRLAQETESLIRYYNDKAKDVEEQMDRAVEAWKNNPQEPRSLQLRAKQKRFRELHERHIEAIKAGNLTLAQVYANGINQFLIGRQIAYDPGFHQSKATYIDKNYDSRWEPSPDELVQILNNSSNQDWIRLSAAQVIVGQCNDDAWFARYRRGLAQGEPEASIQCIAALAAVFEYPNSEHDLWEGAKITLCKAAGKAQLAIPSLIDVLSQRISRKDWRSWISAMEVIGCIGPSANIATPHIIAILKTPNPDPKSYVNAEYVRQIAIITLGKLGKSADASAALRTITAGRYSDDLKKNAIMALQEIEK